MALTAAALSLTIGVLVGTVLILGSRARSEGQLGGRITVTAESPSGVVASSSAPSSDPASSRTVVSTVSSSRTALTSSSTAPTGTSPVRPPRPARTNARTTPVRPPRATPTTAPIPSRPVIAYSTVLVPIPATSTPASTTAPAPVIAPAPVTTPAALTAPAPTSVVTTGTGPPSAPATGPVAGGRCRTLGDKATVAGGWTVFCQTDFSAGGLSWRAVVDGGGCLSRTMTGIGTDGHAYVCRPDRTGLDHWRRA